MHYRTTPVFDQDSLPDALRREHSTKAGTWGVVRLLEGRLRLIFADGRERLLSEAEPGLVRPMEKHRVEPPGPMRMQVEFHDRPPPQGPGESRGAFTHDKRGTDHEI